MGGRGGRGGRGNRGGLSFQRHDIQLAEEEKTSDVPLLFPTCPTMPTTANPNEELDPEMQRLLKRYNAMRTWYTKSPFHLKLPPTETTEGSVPDVVRHLDEAVVAHTAVKQQPLNQVVVMHSKYLPEELYSAKDHKQSMKKRSAAFFKQNSHIQEEALAVRLKALAAEDAKSKAAGEGSDGEEGKGPGGKDGEEEAEEQSDDDDDLDHEDDDYYQGEAFDDDEEYGDDGDDGGDGENNWF